MTPLEEDFAFAVESVREAGESFRFEYMFDRFAVVVPNTAALSATRHTLQRVFDERVLSRVWLLEQELPTKFGRGA